MLRRYATFINLLRSASDIIIIASTWLMVYHVRFYTDFFSTNKGVPYFSEHLALTLPVTVICFLCCVYAGLYQPKRVSNFLMHLVEVFRAVFFSGLFILTFFYFIQDFPYSRKLLVLFIALQFVGLSASHLLTMQIVRLFRKKGYNLRHYVIIGANLKGLELQRDISQINWLGLNCSFFVDDDSSLIGKKIGGVPVYGPIERVSELVEANPIDEVYLALSGDKAQKAYPFLGELQSKGITIRIIPDWGNLVSFNNATTVTIGSQVLFSAAESPLNGTNVILKELFDRAAACFLLILFAVPGLIIALLVKITSNGPIFFKQMRIGMDQKEFLIYKFRTMKYDNNVEDKPQWTKANDPRRTPFGRWLRRTSLDELPQLINVLKGDMSLVGPRPERPFFTKKFSEEYNKYMLRHKVKSGITGWAQINGFRGDTSLRKRLLYDLYYVRNWSWSLDFWILLRTPWHIIKGENAH